MKRILIITMLLMLFMPFALAAPQPQLELTGKQMIPLYGAPWIGDNSIMYFGNDKDAYMEYSTSTGYLTLSGVAATSLTNGGVLGANNHLTCAAGSSMLDLHLGTGVTKTTTGVFYDLGSSSWFGSATNNFYGPILAGGAVTANSLAVNTTSVFTGAATFNAGATVASAQTLAVTTADKLTVGGVIVPQYWDFNVPISATTVDSNIFIPTSNWQVIAVSEVHAVAGDNGSPVTAVIRKTNSTGAPSAGLVVTAGSFDLKGTANTIQNGVMRGGSDAWVTKVNSTERLTLDVTGTLTTLAGGVVTVRLKRIA